MQLAVKNYVIQTKVMGTPQLRFGALGERHLNCHAVVPTCTPHLGYICMYIAVWYNTVVGGGRCSRCKLAEARTQIERCCMKDDNEGCDQAERMSTDADGLIGMSDTATDAVADGT